MSRIMNNILHVCHGETGQVNHLFLSVASRHALAATRRSLTSEKSQISAGVEEEKNLYFFFLFFLFFLSLFIFEPLISPTSRILSK